MFSKMKIKVDFEGKKADELMSFVIDTQEGKYTKEKPVLTQVTYKSLVIDQQDFTSSYAETDNDVYLFGVSN